MNSLVALTIILVVFAIGDIIAVKTKSVVSTLFFASAFFIIAFWLGLPTSIFQDSTLLALGQVLITMLLVHMGTMLNMKQLKEQWKTVVIATMAIVGVAFAVIGIGSLFIGLEEALVAAPPVSGGAIAGIQMTEAANALGRGDLAILASLLVVVQGFVGYPLASIFLKKEAASIKNKFIAGEITAPKETDTEDENNKKKKRLLKKVPKAFETDNYFLAKTALVALLATFLATFLTEVVGVTLIDANIMSLLLGVLFSELGFLDNQILIKGNSFGIAMAALTAVILAPLADATPEVLQSLVVSIVVALSFGTIGIILFSFIATKFFKMSKWMGLGIGISALFGFPGTFIVSNEVATTLSETEEEKTVILDRLLPKMLVAGFVTVSIGSVILAGIAASFLTAGI